MGTCSSMRRRMMMSGGEVSMPNYLCFSALEDGTFTLSIGKNLSATEFAYVEYSIDGGTTWVKTNNINSTAVTVTTPSLTTGSTVLWRGSGNRTSTYNSASDSCIFSSSGAFDCSGDILTLLHGKAPNPLLKKQYMFYSLFSGSKISNAEDLIISCQKAGQRAFMNMFNGCSYLTHAPSIEATECDASCFENMFINCTSLINPPPYINATAFSSRTCYAMFLGCKVLTTTPVMEIRSVDTYTFQSMFEGCSSLASTNILINSSTVTTYTYYHMYRNCGLLSSDIVLPALILASNCYREMFENDKKISYIKMLATNISASNCLFYWVNKVATNGIFVKHIDATWTTVGTSGVPSNWRIIYYDPSEDKYYTSQNKSQECDDHGNPI